MNDTAAARGASSDTDASGRTFGPYRALRLLREGGGGSVYEAVHLGLDKRVALKLLKPQHGGDGRRRARFLAEGKAAARVRHPHVVDIYDVGAAGEQLYLAMELLEGEDLGCLLAREGRRSVGEALALLLPIAQALAAVHRAGLVHRDVKPGNVFITRAAGGAPLARLIDFGIARVARLDEDDARTALTTEDGLLGTPHYMSPEQVKSPSSVDARSDQYSFGATLYECVIGRRPFDGSSTYEVLHRIVEGDFAAPRAERKDLPAAFEDVLLRSMSRNPADRFPSMDALAEALAPFAPPAARSTPAPSPRSAGASPGPRRRRRGPALAVAAMVCAALAVATMRVATRPAAPVAPPATGADPRPAMVDPATAPPAGRADSYTVRVRVDPALAAIDLDGRTMGAGAVTVTLPRDGVRHSLRAHAAGFEPQTVVFVDAPPPEALRLVSSPAKRVAAPPAPKPRPPRVSTNGAPILE